MRKWIIKLMDKNVYGLTIDLFDAWHIAYLVVIVGVAITLGVLLKNKSDKVKKTVMQTYLIVAAVSYALDFILMPFYDETIDVDKLPFHICTVMSIIACFAQFNKHFSWLKAPAVMLCIVGPLMYICYPGTALGDISPLSYKVTQTFFYHACLFTYGYLAIAFGEIKPEIKKCWRELALICAIAVWAGIGNLMFNDGTRHFDWFFLTGSTFPFVPTFLMPFAVIAAIFSMVMIIYGIYYGVMHIAAKRKQKAVQPEAEQAE